MNRPITRRAAAKMLLAGPAALALPRSLPGSPPERKPSDSLTPTERRQYEKSVAQLREVAGKIRQARVSMGAEPAFVFRPLIPKK